MPAYDLPVKMLIDGLNKTGHITHTQHRKTMVTLHHNAGRLSHEGVLEVWKTRPASAHLDVDGAGAVAQYAWLNEYAWACGNTKGNQDSISIEMANSGVGGNWPVAEVTWKSAARLAGWIFAKIVGVRPTPANLVMHKHWKATECAGPYITNVMPQILILANQSYDYFVGGGSAAPPPATAPQNSGGKTNVQLAQEVLDGKWGNGDERKKRLTDAGYNFAAIQAEVNRRLGGGAPSSGKLSLHDVAKQVIAGLWGNGALRRDRLQGAGYNYAQVQAEVNRQLR
jgi:hypothetical protein